MKNYRYDIVNEYIGYIDVNNAKKYKVMIKKVDRNWVTGTIQGYKFSAQVFNEPSINGLYKGRISRLFIIKKGCPHWGDTIYHYERALGAKPTKKGLELSRKLLKVFPKNMVFGEENE